MTKPLSKEKLKDTMGRPLTQSLFLEIGYNVQYAVYTLNDEDKEYDGRIYPSLKRLYLECEDPTEYNFAITHLLGWNHWLRLNENKVLKPYFDEWRVEMEVMLRSEAVRAIMDLTTSDNTNFQAAKWLADGQWSKRGAGRPSKADIERETSIRTRIGDELNFDIERMNTIGTS